MSKLVLEKSNELPHSWIKTELDNCVHILDGKRTPINSGEREKRKGNVPYYGATGQVGWIDDHLFDEEIVLLGEDGAPFFENFKNKAYLVTGKSWVNNHAHVLKGISGLLLNKFLCHYLNQIDYHGYVNGTTRLKLNQSAMKQIPILLPPLNEQKRIVSKIEELLSKLDSATKLLNKVKLQLKQYRQSLLKATVEGTLFGDKIKYPKKPISEVIESVGQGWSPRCENYASLNEKDWAVIKTTSIQPMKFDGNQNKKLPDTLEPKSHLELKKGDILITRAGPRSRVGIACLVRKTRKHLLLCDKAYRIRCKKNLVDSVFLEIVLNAPYIMKEIDMLKTGISDSGVNITQDRFLGLSVPLPSLSDQKKIIITLENIFSQIDQYEMIVEHSLRQSVVERKNILNVAFAGQIVLQDPNDESASILLEKIRREREKISQNQTIIKTRQFKSKRTKNAK